ncbi:hypothetical protein J1N35_008163 [Gossypium stocksii]|uniref:Uncharacterized protein n=1 Tax=Gossypium stocksii TaxID=47602 RepID=A0A9D3W9T4_9ROSI|nr:hypothetical protein J1N35_008163 [Gossypium stocksii]
MASRNPSLVENSPPTSNSPESNEKLAWPGLLCGSSVTPTNHLLIDRHMHVGWKEYAVNHGSSSFSSSPHLSSSSSIGTGSSLKNNATFESLTSGSQTRSTLDSLPFSFLNPPTYVVLDVLSSIDVVGRYHNRNFLTKWLDYRYFQPFSHLKQEEMLTTKCPHLALKIPHITREIVIHYRCAFAPSPSSPEHL